VLDRLVVLADDAEDLAVDVAGDGLVADDALGLGRIREERRFEHRPADAGRGARELRRAVDVREAPPELVPRGRADVGDGGKAASVLDLVGHGLVSFATCKRESIRHLPARPQTSARARPLAAGALLGHLAGGARSLGVLPGRGELAAAAPGAGVLGVGAVELHGRCLRGCWEGSMFPTLKNITTCTRESI
jgi:hypothetical protein